MRTGIPPDDGQLAPAEDARGAIALIPVARALHLEPVGLPHRERHGLPRNASPSYADIRVLPVLGNHAPMLCDGTGSAPHRTGPETHGCARLPRLRRPGARVRRQERLTQVRARDVRVDRGGGDPLVAEEHIACFNWCSNEEMHDISSMAIRINDFLCGLFAAIDIRLIDFKLEFGRLYDGDYSRVILADEISPDGCRLWDMATGEKLDKDRFRRDLGGEEEAYREVARRLGLLNAEDNGPGEVFDLSHARSRLRGPPPLKK